VIRKAPLLTAGSILACLAAMFSVQPSLACSVCYGDPNSLLSHGANAGVIVLLCVVGTLLAMIVSLFLFWMRRANQLEGALSELEDGTGL
jgi:hypothetical protein